jgi:proteasome lid subunit RPN8/RPN11
MPGVRLLGWYHSHPGLGVQMSSTDRQTQQRHFAADWQVGLVVDPYTYARQFYLGAAAEPARWLAFVEGAGEPR